MDRTDNFLLLCYYPQNLLVVTLYFRSFQARRTRTRTTDLVSTYIPINNTFFYGRPVIRAEVCAVCVPHTTTTLVLNQ